MITRYKIFKENLLKPTTNIQDKLEKIQAPNKQLLIDNEILHFDYLEIDESWDFDIDTNLIKTKKIIANIELELNHIPSWIKDIEIDGSFDCDSCNLTSLKNCPKIIHNNFDCEYNKLTTLEDGPTYVGRNYYCNNNSYIFTKEYVSSICDIKNRIIC